MQLFVNLFVYFLEITPKTALSMNIQNVPEFTKYSIEDFVSKFVIFAFMYFKIY